MPKASSHRVDGPLIIEVAINGMSSKERNPHVPRSAQEIISDTLACVNAGANLIHAHNDDIAMTGEEAAENYLAAWRPILQQCPDLLWYPTLTSASDAAVSLEHIAIIQREVGLRLGLLDPGSTNIGMPDADGIPVGGVYANNYDDIRYSFDFCREHKLGPSLAIYEPGFMQTTLAYYRAGRLPAGTMVKFYFGGECGLMATAPGVTFGLPPTENALAAYLDMLDGIDLPWSVSVWGGDLMQTPVARMALERGGHLHLGLEEFYCPNRQPTNEELVREAVALAEEIGRPIASTEQAVQIMALPMAE